MTLRIRLEPPFDFELTLRSHGWIYLKPYLLEIDEPGYQRFDRLSTGNRIQYKVIQQADDLIEIQPREALTSPEEFEVISMVRYALRLDENLGEFYELCLKLRKLKFVATRGLGRLLRGSTLFEDLVKTLCTTNTTWQHTIAMVSNLVEQIGDGCFPNAGDILKFGKKNLESKLKLGYRAQYLWELCERLEAKDIDLDPGKLKKMPGPEAATIIKSLKGFGDYAVNHALLMIGHYDAIPIDSLVRQHCKDKFNIKSVTKKQIDKRYARWGKWQALAYQFERIGERFNQC